MLNFYFMVLLLYFCYKVCIELLSFYRKIEVRWCDNDNLLFFLLCYFWFIVCCCLISMNFLLVYEYYVIVIKFGVCFGCICLKESFVN